MSCWDTVSGLQRCLQTGHKSLAELSTLHCHDRFNGQLLPFSRPLLPMPTHCMVCQLAGTFGSGIMQGLATWQTVCGYIGDVGNQSFLLPFCSKAQARCVENGNVLI